MITYLMIGFLVYLFASILNYETFEGASWSSIFRGFILGLLFWPILFPIAGIYFVFKKKPK